VRHLSHPGGRDEVSAGRKICHEAMKASRPCFTASVGAVPSSSVLCLAYRYTGGGSDGIWKVGVIYGPGLLLDTSGELPSIYNATKSADL
jgi:hypothetical protein